MITTTTQIGPNSWQAIQVGAGERVTLLLAAGKTLWIGQSDARAFDAESMARWTSNGTPLDLGGEPLTVWNPRSATETVELGVIVSEVVR